MELAGEEKKIRPLFSELRVADEQTAPSFAAIWNRAHLRHVRRRRAFSPVFVAAAAVLVCALASLVWWSTRPHSAQPANLVAQVKSNPQEVALAATLHQPELAVSPADDGSSSIRARPRYHRPVTVPHEAGMNAATQQAELEAKAISNWQSPTATLLSSSHDELLNSIPQLDENSKELKSFLPSKNK